MQLIQYELEVYTFQIDFAGHVSNCVYPEWMEIGRLRLLEAIGMPIQDILKQGFYPVLVHPSVTYKVPIYLGDRVRAELWLSELKHASAVMNFHFYNSARALAAEGYQKGIFVDAATKRPRRLTLSERSRFQPFLQG